MGWNNVQRLCTFSQEWESAKEVFTLKTEILQCFTFLKQHLKQKKLSKWSFFKPLERFWRVNIKSGLTSCIFSFEMQVMVKRRFENQIALDHTNLKNDQILYFN
jgi:hypothetical protein